MYFCSHYTLSCVKYIWFLHFEKYLFMPFFLFNLRALCLHVCGVVYASSSQGWENGFRLIPNRIETAPCSIKRTLHIQFVVRFVLKYIIYFYFQLTGNRTVNNKKIIIYFLFFFFTIMFHHKRLMDKSRLFICR